MNRFRMWCVLLSLGFFPSLAFGQQPPAVLSASATSSASGSSPITCLLDAACTGFWSPGSLDSGYDEGVFIQFEKPVTTNTIQVNFAETAGLEALDIQLSVDGKVATEKGWTKSKTSNKTFEFKGGGSPLRSVFIKLTPHVNGASGVQPFQMTKIVFANVSMTLPKLVSAQVKASSILDPTTAYDPANLFDSRTDFAWATDGKKTTGKGESLTLSLGAKQNLSGLIVWNGYQRSDSHFHANGRVTQLEVKAEDGQTQTLTLQDVMGPQKLTFAKPFQNVGQLTFTLKEIKPGDKYKDVLLSELRLVDDKGAIVLPLVALPKAVVPANWQALVDRSFSSVLSQFGAEGCSHNHIRLRSNGTFVIYKEELEPTSAGKKMTRTSPDVMEGNWEPKGAMIRIFGKKYPTTLQSSDYLQTKEKSMPAAIFQSELSLKPFTGLSAQEKDQALSLILRAKNGGTPSADEIKNAGEKLKGAPNPYDLSSSVFTEALAPSDSLKLCQ